MTRSEKVLEGDPLVVGFCVLAKRLLAQEFNACTLHMQHVCMSGISDKTKPQADCMRMQSW